MDRPISANRPFSQEDGPQPLLSPYPDFSGAGRRADGVEAAGYVEGDFFVRLEKALTPDSSQKVADGIRARAVGSIFQP